MQDIESSVVMAMVRMASISCFTNQDLNLHPTQVSTLSLASTPSQPLSSQIPGKGFGSPLVMNSTNILISCSKHFLYTLWSISNLFITFLINDSFEHVTMRHLKI